MNHASFTAQSNGINIPKAVAATVDTVHRIRQWEKASGLNYFLFRETLKRVCREKLEAIAAKAKGYDCTVSSSVDGFLEEDYAESDIIIPIDDDDLLHESVLGVPEYFSDPGINLVVWGRLTDAHGKERYETVHPYLDTNNWAMHGSYLKTWPLDVQGQILAKHQKAHSEVGKRLGLIAKIPNVIGPDFYKANNPYVALTHPSVIDLADQFHSVYYEHSGSISYLAYKVGNPTDLVLTFRNLPLHPLFDKDVYQSLQGAPDAAAV
jgi:hypothetical protein